MSLKPGVGKIFGHIGGDSRQSGTFSTCASEIHSVPGPTIGDMAHREAKVNCTICRNTLGKEITISLLRFGTRFTARQFEVSKSALDRHKRHLPRNLAGAYQHMENESSASILSEVKKLVRECRGIARRAKSDRQWSQAVAALREVRGCLDLLARLKHEAAQQRSTAAVSISEEGYGFTSVKDLSDEEIIEHTIASRKRMKKMDADMDRLFGREIAEKIETEVRNYDPDVPIDPR